jgi:DNA polymerase/3'-5' exonuclease PolX
VEEICVEREMKYDKILPIAEKYLEMIEPYCTRAMIAGSIRRKKLEPNDIELVIMIDPKKMEKLISVMDEFGGRIRGDITGKACQRWAKEKVKLDIFIAALDGTNWGNIVLIRTGSAAFSRWMMGFRSKEVGLKHEGGYLWKGDKRLECKEEMDVFRLLKMDWIEPEDRSWTR